MQNTSPRETNPGIQSPTKERILNVVRKEERPDVKKMTGFDSEDALFEAVAVNMNRWKKTGKSEDRMLEEDARNVVRYLERSGKMLEAIPQLRDVIKSYELDRYKRLQEAGKDQHVRLVSARERIAQIPQNQSEGREKHWSDAYREEQARLRAQSVAQRAGEENLPSAKSRTWRDRLRGIFSRR